MQKNRAAARRSHFGRQHARARFPVPCHVASQSPVESRDAMTRTSKPITILMADDDADDRQLTREAFETSRLANDLRLVQDGAELIDYLCRRNRYADPALSPRPGLILLDLNMPKKDGRQALSEIKADPNLRNIRIVVMTTSKAEED